jgi:hypothetical protein
LRHWDNPPDDGHEIAFTRDAQQQQHYEPLEAELPWLHELSEMAGRPEFQTF